MGTNKVVTAITIKGWENSRNGKLVLPTIQALANVLKSSGEFFETVCFLGHTFYFISDCEKYRQTVDVNHITALVTLTHNLTLAIESLKKKYGTFLPVKTNWKLEGFFNTFTEEELKESFMGEREFLLEKLYKEEFPKKEVPKRDKDILFFLSKKGWDKNLLPYQGMFFPRVTTFKTDMEKYGEFNPPEYYIRNKNIVYFPENKNGLAGLMDAVNMGLFRAYNPEQITTIPNVKVEHYGKSK